MNRQMVEELSLRKANEDTRFFWEQVRKNEGIQYAPSQQEEQLFAKHKDGQPGISDDAIPVEKSGPHSDEIDAIERFNELEDKIPLFIMTNIQRMKYDRPTPIQKHSIPLGLAGLDLMCCAQTVSILHFFLYIRQ